MKSGYLYKTAFIASNRNINPNKYNDYVRSIIELEKDAVGNNRCPWYRLKEI